MQPKYYDKKRGIAVAMDKKEMLRSLIRMADSCEEADKIIMEFTQWKTSEQKLAFLDGLFNYSIFVHGDDTITQEKRFHSDCAAVLNTIVGAKWR